MNFSIFNNGIVSEVGMSGSDRRALEWSRCFLKHGKIFLIIPKVGLKRYENLKVNQRVNFLITSSLPVEKAGVFPLYLWRAFKTTLLVLKFKLEENDIIYSTCDLIPDSIPSFFLKLKNPQARWVCGLHLLAPNPFLGFIGVETGKLHFPSLRDFYYFFSQRTVMFLLKHFTSLVLVSNKANKDYLEKLGFNPQKVIVAYGAVNTDFIPKGEREKIYDACFVGRFHPQKGVLELIEIWEKVCQKYKEAKLAIIGEGELGRQIREKIKEKRLENNIKLLGFLDGEEKFEIIKSSKVGLFPSTYESFGMVALEIMVCGVPVVAYNLPIFNEIYTSGMVKVPISDVSQFAQKTIELLENEKMREKIGQEAEKLASHFTWEKTAQEILERLS